MRIRANVLNLFLIDRGVKYSCVFERDVDVVLGSAKWDLSITFVIPLHLILESASPIRNRLLLSGNPWSCPKIGDKSSYDL